MDMQLLDGKQLAEKMRRELKEEVARSGLRIRLGIMLANEDPATLKFIEQKRRAAEEIGVEVKIFPFQGTFSTNELRRSIAQIVHDDKNSGIVIQLPLPSAVNTQYILNAVPPQKDVDMLAARSLGNFIVGKSPILPPVVGAVQALLEQYSIDFMNREIVIVGAGKLVGRPLAMFFIDHGATVSVINESTSHKESFLKRADIIISGAGRPGIITGDLIKEGSTVIDAGTSESGGRVVGDVDFETCAKKAAYISPVPGGVGPLTVVMLLKNLVTLAELRKK